MFSLKTKAKHALGWDVTGTLIRQGSGFVITIFLARLLEPEEFGEVGMSMVFITIIQVFVDIGFTSALIQNKTNTNITYSSVFYINILSGIILTSFTYLLAPLVGDFYNNHRITEILRSLSVLFILTSLIQVQIAILQRELDFKTLTIRIAAASICGGITGIIMAYFSYGVFSLVGQQIAHAIVSLLLIWKISDWKPDLNFSLTEIKKLYGFSIYVFMDQLTSTFFQKLDTLFVGKIFSAELLGYYTRAESLNNQVSNYSALSLRKVFFPVLSKVEEYDHFVKLYLKLVSLICFLSFLLSGVLYVLAEPLILTLFGAKWTYSIIIFEILIFKSFNIPLNSMMLNALLSRGESKKNFQIGIVRKLVRATPILVGFKFGFLPFVWSVTLVSYVLTIYNTYFLQKVIGINMKYHLKKIFEGVIPLILLLPLTVMFPAEVWMKLLIALMFVITYLVYSHFIKMEGYLYAKSEIMKFTSRNK